MIDHSETIGAALKLIKAGATAPKYNKELRGYRLWIYRVVNVSIIALIAWVVYTLLT
jgi:hypothetical protein